MSDIKFGTDGWRAIIADGYTFHNLNIVTQATGRWISDEKITQNGVVIGYDSRFLSKKFARYSASVFAAMDIPVRISNSITPTPAVSLAAKQYNAAGIVITASHNPPEYNGFKIKAPFGGSATPDQIAGVEQKLKEDIRPLRVENFKSYLKSGQIRVVDFTLEYIRDIQNKIDLDAIRRSKIKIAHDPMYGAGQGVVKRLLADQVVEIRSEINPSFGGIAPEPIISKLDPLSEIVVNEGCAVGLANDGDADRIGMMDEKGNFVDSHRILSLLVEYLHREKGLTGTIVKTFSTTNMLEKQAAEYGLDIETTPIGFKYIAEIILNGDVLVGGEESGGLAAKGHIPERDGIYIGLLITEMMVKTGKKLSQLVEELFQEYGPHAYFRNDMNTDEKKKNAMMAYCKNKKLDHIGGLNVVSWQNTDGIKHIMEDGSWLLVRPSGTEPVLRIYSEAPTVEQAENLVEDASSWVDNPQILE